MAKGGKASVFFMIFSSIPFMFFFLPISLIILFLIPVKFRKYGLIILSSLFFVWGDEKNALLFFGLILCNFCFGELLLYLKKRKSRIAQYAISIGVLLNIAFLVYFRYADFITSTLNRIPGIHIEKLQTNAPRSFLGVSFIVFAAISYLLDIANKKKTDSVGLFDFACYMTFFPKLIQGPITRFDKFIVQLKKLSFNLDDFTIGIERFIIGLSKKVLIADVLGTTIDPIFAHPANQNAVSVAWLGAIGYAFQIYFDFSGYSDMAVGLAKMIGITLPENFNYPYISSSITEFWRRWHITLNTWFRDYVFYPLEFKRRKTKILRQETNTLIVFLLTGLWHGASWNFVAWGLWHGFFISFETFMNRKKIKICVPKLVKHLLTLFIILVGWVFFRSNGLINGIRYLGVMFGMISPDKGGFMLSWYLTPKVLFTLGIAVIASIPCQMFIKKISLFSSENFYHLIIKNICFLSLFLLSIVYALSSSYSPFIYFQF